MNVSNLKYIPELKANFHNKCNYTLKTKKHFSPSLHISLFSHLHNILLSMQGLFCYF